MASAIPDRDISPIISAARAWIDRCLLKDLAMLADAPLWQLDRILEVRHAFVENFDDGTDDFITKLKRQMQDVSSDGQCLMAEMLWVLLLFPSNVRPDKKRQHIVAIWQLSGRELDKGSPLLQDRVLEGIGSGGPGFNNHRWRELAFLIELTADLKRRAEGDRTHVFADYETFLSWIASVAQTGSRQFRHMLRYFAFPSLVERMSSNRDRRRVLAAFGVAPEAETKRWPDRQLDDALLSLRRTLETQYPGQILDFYKDPLRGRWRPEGDPEPPEVERPVRTLPLGHHLVSEPPRTPPRSGAPLNLILYGPPGTGKTYWMRKKMEEYTDSPTSVDRGTWLQEVISRAGWRSVIAAVLSRTRRPLRVPEVRDHEFIKAKARQRGRTSASVHASIWGYLQQHTPDHVTTVNVSVRRGPAIFTKAESGEWSLVDEWQDLDPESAELTRLLNEGPGAVHEPIRRYRAITFHPSYSYEDFVQGIRPVADGDDARTDFRLVDGVFKRLCDEARANPAKRYALFIDEINRANIAKVFGELISLIEPDKRTAYDSAGRVSAGMTVHLPGSNDDDGQGFGVPDNVDIYGTMNTADRSIALLDVALRRRFVFRELEPQYNLLSHNIGSVHLGRFLERINDRLEYLLDRDHRIGHAYLLPVQSITDLREVVADQLIPLLQEFFFDDFSKVHTVLATNPAAPPLLRAERLRDRDLFQPGASAAVGERVRYVVTPRDTWTEQTFAGVYGRDASSDIVATATDEEDE